MNFTDPTRCADFLAKGLEAAVTMPFSRRFTLLCPENLIIISKHPKKIEKIQLLSAETFAFSEAPSDAEKMFWNPF